MIVLLDTLLIQYIAMHSQFYMIFKKPVTLCFILFFTISCNSEQSTVEEIDISEGNTRELALAIAINKYKNYAEQHQPSSGYPRSIEDNTWKLTNWKSWTDGFFPGILWQLSVVDPSLEDQADRWTTPLSNHATLASHDLGFIINNSFGKGYRLSGNSTYLPVLESATNTLSSRYNQQVKSIRSWDFGSYDFPVIIDNMMNLNLLFDSSKIFQQEPFYSQAINHAYTTLNNHLRPDGSSFHLVDFIADSGNVIGQKTVQGLADDSTWARGQAWGIYGFTIAYIETGELDFLITAQSMANYFIENLPEDHIPYWDFDVTDENSPRDSSAAAIAASALWMLSNLQSEQVDKQRFSESSVNIINSLMSADYFNHQQDFPALLLHATGNKPGDKEVDTSLIYADYYFIEALLMQLNNSFTPI